VDSAISETIITTC